MGISHPANAGVVDAISFKQLEMPGKELDFERWVIAGGQRLKRGSVLGKVTANSKLVLSLSAAGDGSQTPFAVLREDIDTYDIDDSTGRDMIFPVIRGGALNPDALVLGTGHTIASVKAGFATAAQGIRLTAPGYSG